MHSVKADFWSKALDSEKVSNQELPDSEPSFRPRSKTYHLMYLNETARAPLLKAKNVVD